MLRSLSDDLLDDAVAGECPGCGPGASWCATRARRSLRAAPSAAPIPGASVVDRVLRVRGRRARARRARQVPQRTRSRCGGSRHALAGGARRRRCRSTSSPGRPRARAHPRPTGSTTASSSPARSAPTLGCAPERLLRRDTGPPQTGRDARGAAGRARRCTRRARSPGATVLVVDDVATTGATLLAAAARACCACRCRATCSRPRSPARRGPRTRSPGAAYTPATPSGRAPRRRRAD